MLVTPQVARGGSQGSQCCGLTPPGPHLPRPRLGLGASPGAPGSASCAGSKVRHGHRLRSSCSRGEAGTGPARAGPGVPSRLLGGDPGVEGAQVARSLARCWGRPPGRAVRQAPASAAAGRAKATLSLLPPWFPPAGRQRRFPLGETTRILPGVPRPAPALRPPPLGWGAGAGRPQGAGSGSPGREVAGGRGAAGP